VLSSGMELTEGSSKPLSENLFHLSTLLQAVDVIKNINIERAYILTTRLKKGCKLQTVSELLRSL